MSYEAMTWAVKIIEQNKAWKTPLRFVLLIMANRADEEGILYPSVRWIMERTALGESTIREATRELKQLGLLIKEPRQREQGGQTSNEYRLAMSQFVLKLEVVAPPPAGGGTVHGGGGAVRRMEGAPPPTGPHDTKEETKEKKKDGARAARLPPDFTISDAVRAWAKAEGHEPYLDAHFAYFVLDAQSRSTAKYVDWDKALMKAITADWGNVRKQAQMTARASGAIVPLSRPKVLCRYCPAVSHGNVGGIHHCANQDHFRMAMDGEPAPARAAA